MSFVSGGAETRPGRLGRLAATATAALAWVLEAAGFWTAVLVPVAAVGLLVLQPEGWLPLAAGLFALDGLAVVVGHCHGVEC